MHRIIVLSKKALGYLPYIPAVFIYTLNPISFFKGYFINTPRTVFLRNGLKLITDNPDDISSISTILIKDEYGLRSLKNKTAKKIIIDIGANKGYFATLAAKNFNSQVFAYEPIPDTFQKLSQNITDNNLSNVTLFKAGVAGHSGERNFSFSEDKSILSSMVFNPGQNSIIVQCTTLKNIFADNNLNSVDLLKMDCEGAEFETLYESDDSTLVKINRLHMEYHNDSSDLTHNINHLTDFLKSKNFNRVLFKPANDSVGIAWFERV